MKIIWNMGLYQKEGKLSRGGSDQEQKIETAVKKKKREEMQKSLSFWSLKTDVVVVLPEASIQQLERAASLCQIPQAT